MPNWCGNYAVIGHKDSNKLKELKAAMEDGEWFSMILPTPKELEDTRSPMLIETAEDQTRSDELIKKYGFNNWYDWRVHNWGTKWDCTVDGPDINDEGTILDTGYFETAWAPATEIYRHMEDQGFTVTAYYYESGCGFCGTWEDGVDSYTEIDDMTSTEVAEAINSDLDEIFGISENMAEREAEERDELEEWYEEGVEKKGLTPHTA